MIKHVFEDPIKVKILYEKLITLAPKIKNIVKIKINNAISLKHFKSISLCNMSYKVITKIIAYNL